MSRYLILVIINLPIISLAILSALVNYKMGRSSRRRFVVQILFWLVVLAGLLSAEPIYQWLFDKALTQTEPLSLFDVVQITAIIFLTYVATRLWTKTERLEERLKTLNTETSLMFSELENKNKSVKLEKES